MIITTDEIRRIFQAYFAGHAHTVVPSSSLIPGNDPTLLFTNAGMVPFKDIFLGREKTSYQRAVSVQRCMRAGGKHNDLNNVGHTARHHTFFEMLGNFSFGDYFKQQAIVLAWQFIIEELNINKDKLWITIYQDDEESEQIWREVIGVPAERIIRCGEKDNFWSMGDTGPCGPSSEIFYDHGSEISGGLPGSADEEGDRFVEIWNLVFMQYNRQADGTLQPLPRPCVDTGMGLERIAAVMQGVHNNYETDVFVTIIAQIKKVLTTQVAADQPQGLYVIADHIRAATFMVWDGITPSNEGRGYVLRRIIRRALRYGYQMGQREAFFYRLVGAVVDTMGGFYQGLAAQQAFIEQVLKEEEAQFAKTLAQGMRLFTQAIESIQGDVLSGEVVFKLYDTYGFPVDLTGDLAREHGLVIDQHGFAQCMQAQQQRSRAQRQFVDTHQDLASDQLSSWFTGYEVHHEQAAKVMGVWCDGVPCEQLSSHEAAMVVLDKTPFYAEAGGQVGDKGQLLSKDMVFTVQDTQKKGDVIVHYGVLERGHLQVGCQVAAEVDASRRDRIRANHSATHLLHAALRLLIGEQVEQRGSLVNEQKLRFDFVAQKPLTLKQLLQIEQLVNTWIRDNSLVVAELMGLEAAKQKGAMALFGEKYGEQVRVLTMANGQSIELCGGMHVQRTGDIGMFKCVGQSSVAAGIRRIEAVTGEAALGVWQQQQQQLEDMATKLRCTVQEIPDRVQQIQDNSLVLQKQHAQLQQRSHHVEWKQLLTELQTIENVSVMVKQVTVSDNKQLRACFDYVKQALPQPYIILLAAAINDKVALIAGVSDELTATLRAGDLVKEAAVAVDGRGGGRADMAQAGGSNVHHIQRALQQGDQWIKRHLNDKL